MVNLDSARRLLHAGGTEKGRPFSPPDNASTAAP